MVSGTWGWATARSETHTLHPYPCDRSLGLRVGVERGRVLSSLNTFSGLKEALSVLAVCPGAALGLVSFSLF